MKRIAFLCIISSFLSSSSLAQSFDEAKSFQENSRESFQEFRNSILNNYNDFKRTILEHYADFLNGEWHEYESLEGLKRDNTPKPKDAPRVNLPDVPGQPSEPGKQPGNEKPSLGENNKPEPKPEVKPEPKPEVKPGNPPTPPRPTNPMATPGRFNFNFYDMPMSLADINFSISNSLNSPADFSNQWKALEASKVADKMLPSIKNAIKETGLNDYLTYKYLESYVNSKFPNVKESAKMALVHYLIVNLGYDARIAVTTKGTPLLLIPFKQTVYGRSFLSLNNQRYYIFPPEGYDVSAIFQEKVMTCQLPTDVNTGNIFDLVVGELNLPVKPKKFDLEYGPLHLTGEMNENLIPILYKYPQMPIADYARSNIQPQLRKELAQQIKTQLGGMNGDEDVEALLHFTQNAFQYATDDAYHGFEKPYFIEETLFYPKNDCEDRAIFYTYFLHNALGRDTQLISFPGHEAASVVLKQPKNGVSYQNNGKTYYISDPTYIGASTGMVMPTFINVRPEVDYTY